MKPAPFAYVRPGTLDEALAALAADPHAKVLAGGQSLVPLLSMRLVAPSMLVDLNGLPDLDHVRVDAEGVRIGALARHAAVEADADARRVQPLVSLALRMVAHPTIRNRGTTVGSIVHADASAEMPVVLLLLGGHVTAVSTSGTRTIEATDLYLGPLETTLRPDEVAVDAFFPALPADAGVGFEEISRRHGDYALCGVAAVVRADDAARVTSVRVGYLSVCEVPTVVDLSEVFADVTLGGPIDDAVLDRRPTWPWTPWSPRATSTPPPTTAPSSPGCSPAGWSARRTPTASPDVPEDRNDHRDPLHHGASDRPRHRGAAAPGPPARQRHRARRARCRPAGCSPTRCATTSASPAPTWAASTGSAAPARCCSTACRSGPA